MRRGDTRFGLGDDLVDHVELKDILRGEPERGCGLHGPVASVPQDRGAALGRDDRVGGILVTKSATEAEIQSEAVLPAQLLRGLSRLRPSQPEKRLLLAVLDDAVRTFLKYATASGGRGRRLFTEVDAWFASDEGSDSPFSFPNLCYALGFDPAYVREQLREWRGGERTTVRAAARPVCSRAT